jgi:DNA-binding NarL/FixJ family response regulator
VANLSHTPPEVKKAIRKLIDQGCANEQIVNRLHVSKSTLKRERRKYLEEKKQPQVGE